MCLRTTRQSFTAPLRLPIHIIPIAIQVTTLAWAWRGERLDLRLAPGPEVIGAIAIGAVVTSTSITTTTLTETALTRAAIAITSIGGRQDKAVAGNTTLPTVAMRLMATNEQRISSVATLGRAREIVPDKARARVTGHHSYPVAERAIATRAERVIAPVAPREQAIGREAPELQTAPVAARLAPGHRLARLAVALRLASVTELLHRVLPPLRAADLAAGAETTRGPVARGVAVAWAAVVSAGAAAVMAEVVAVVSAAAAAAVAGAVAAGAAAVVAAVVVAAEDAG